VIVLNVQRVESDATLGRADRSLAFAAAQRRYWSISRFEAQPQALANAAYQAPRLSFGSSKHAGMTLPGFIILSGSKVCFTRAIISSSKSGL